MGARIDVSDVLDKISNGEHVTKPQLEAVGESAAFLRDEFLRDAFQAIDTLTPHTAEFQAFKKCLKSMTDHLMKYGFVTIPEIQLLWYRIEEREGHKR